METYNDRLNTWLQHFHFIADPFATYKAENEDQFIYRLWVDRDYLHDIIGYPEWPQTAFLMSHIGEGKTAARKMVEHECTHSTLRGKVFVVGYTYFNPLLAKTGRVITQITARHHTELLARNIVKKLVEESQVINFDKLTEMEKGLLLDYAKFYGDPISFIRLASMFPQDTSEIEWSELTPLEALKFIAQIITKISFSDQDPANNTFQSIYVLVDSVEQTTKSKDVAVDILAPLFRESPLLETLPIAFKFFVSKDVGEKLRSQIPIPDDRITWSNIYWDQAQLREVVKKRLLFFSDGNIASLKNLCSPEIKATVMETLTNACVGSPRKLIILCESLITKHINRNPDDHWLDSKDLSETLVEFSARLKSEKSSRKKVPGYLYFETEVDQVPPRGLHLIKGGKIVIDGKVLNPPLSSLEFRLLNSLYRRQPNIVDHQTLVDEVWGKDSPNANTQNLKQLVSRVRYSLHVDGSGNLNRFIKTAKNRGYLLITED